MFVAAFLRNFFFRRFRPMIKSNPPTAIITIPKEPRVSFMVTVEVIPSAFRIRDVKMYRLYFSTLFIGSSNRRDMALARIRACRWASRLYPVNSLEPHMGLEPTTYALRMRCSTS